MSALKVFARAKTFLIQIFNKLQSHKEKKKQKKNKKWKKSQKLQKRKVLDMYL